MPREALDAPENPPKQELRQVAFGQLEDEVSRTLDSPRWWSTLAITRRATGSDKQVLDGPLQDVIDREVDGIRYAARPQRFVERGEREGRMSSDDDGLPSGLGCPRGHGS